jgi:DNA-binding IclR family transcriptional regulator
LRLDRARRHEPAAGDERVPVKETAVPKTPKPAAPDRAKPDEVKPDEGKPEGTQTANAAPVISPSPYTTSLQQDGSRWLLTAQDDAPPRRPAPGLVPAVENAIAIINYINHTPPHLASLTELATTLGITKSHCHSILKTLVHFGWLRLDSRAKLYELNSGLFASASSLLGAPILDRIRHELGSLVQRIGFPAVLAQPQADDSFVVVDKFNSFQAMEVSYPIGHHLPRDAPANMRAYLAWKSPAEIDHWLESWQPRRYTSTTLMSAELLKAEIAATRKRGYARSIGELTEGLMALGMPIFDRYGEVAYVFTCSGLLSTVAPIEEALAREMINTSIAINRAVLGRMPADFPSL